jgi:LacI family transcriptional regulator, repressor for deo operon, udp, cdd, tsx, nupC, and nupG
VAARSGVSASTVSRALRGVPGIAVGTRDRVRAAAAELGYVANISGSRLATGKTGTVAVVVPSAARWFFGQVIAGAGSVIRAAGMDMLLYELGDREGRRKFFAEQSLRGRADAVLVLSLNLEPDEASQLRGLGVAVAVLGPGPEAFSTVVVDDFQAAVTAVRHLVNLGHQHIAHIGIDNSQDVTSGSTRPAARLAGYQTALSDAGLEAPPSLLALGDLTVDGGAAAMARLISGPIMPTAVFVASDEMAFGALKVLRSAGIRVPEDMSIVGYDNHELSELLDLTSIDQAVLSQGEAAARLVLDALAGSGTGGTGVSSASIPTHLVIRRSTAPPSPLRPPTTNPSAPQGNTSAPQS